MGFFEDLFGIDDSTQMTERDIVNDMLKDSKFGLTSLVKALSETTNPRMRDVLKEQLNTAVQNHFRLSDIAIEKDWYQPNLSPMEQVKEDYEISLDTIES